MTHRIEWINDDNRMSEKYCDDDTFHDRIYFFPSQSRLKNPPGQSNIDRINQSTIIILVHCPVQSIANILPLQNHGKPISTTPHQINYEIKMRIMSVSQRNE